MSFSVLHAFVIEALDTHACQVSEYVHDINEQEIEELSQGDICHIHHFFHISFIIPDVQVALPYKKFSQKPSSRDTIYEYNSYANFLKPPINS